MKKLSQIIATLFIAGYLFSPVDVIPDVPVVGWLDDPIVIAVMLWASGVFDNQLTYKVVDEQKYLPGGNDV